MSDVAGELVIWRNRFHTLFDRTPVPTAICLLDGTITGANPALATLFGTSRSRLRGRAVTGLLRPRVQRDYDRVVEDLKTGRRSRRYLAVHWQPNRTGRLTVQTVPDPNGLALLLTLHADPEPPAFGLELTDREGEILRMVAAGDTSTAIAGRLGLTPDGVTYHLTRLTERFGVPNRTALVARAYTVGLLDATVWPPR